MAYHGDFDWAGITIATRVFSVGAEPWRMTAHDYRAAVASQSAQTSVPLNGPPAPTSWDPGLAAAMVDHGVAVHEEAQLALLLADLHPPRAHRRMNAPPHPAGQAH